MSYCFTLIAIVAAIGAIYLRAKISEAEPAKAVIRYVSFLVVIALVVVMIVKYVFIITMCQSGSMEPTIMTGDMLIGNAFAYSFEEPQRTDIIMLDNEATHGERYIKRIIGLPGEHIAFKNGYVFIDGKLLDEKYLAEDVMTLCDYEFDVPEECFFVMGDNRENSYDSRFWKTYQADGTLQVDTISPYVKKSDVIGKVLFNIPVPW